MKTFKVYLAGPITGLSYDGCTEWREDVKTKLWDRSRGRIEGYSPMRSKTHLSGERAIADGYAGHVLSCDRGIMARDHNDVITSDLLFVNLLGAEKASIGTAMELAWAYDRHIKTVVAIEDGRSIDDIEEMIADYLHDYRFERNDGTKAQLHPDDHEIFADVVRGFLNKIGWKPTIKNVHDHCMLREATSFRVNNLEAAIDVTLKALLP